MFEIVILILSWHPSRNHIGSSLVLKRCAVLMNGDSGILIYCISVEILQQRLKIESRIVMPNLTLLLCTWDVSPQEWGLSQTLFWHSHFCTPCQNRPAQSQSLIFVLRFYTTNEKLLDETEQYIRIIQTEVKLRLASSAEANLYYQHS